MFAAAEAGKLATMRYFIEELAAPLETHNSANSTVWQVAFKKQRHEITAYLEQRGASTARLDGGNYFCGRSGVTYYNGGCLQCTSGRCQPGGCNCVACHALDMAYSGVNAKPAGTNHRKGKCSCH